MTVFELVRENVTAKDAAKLYGLRFDRGGRGFCPWHDDGRHAALKFLNSGLCYCHSCHATGDATAITAQMLGITTKEASERLRADFHLDTPTNNRPDPITKAKAKQRQDANEQFNKRWGFLCDVIHEADAELLKLDKDREKAFDNPQFVAVLNAISRADQQLNLMWESMTSERRA